MNICRIAKITPDGKPWGAPPNGPYYPFYIVFADGATGQANAKTNPPAYKVGDEVGYEITGATPRGVPKLKIDRKADPAFCPNTTPQDFHPDLEAAPPAQKPPQNRPAAPTHTQTPPHGATIGMCVKGALDVWLQQNANSGREWGADSISFVYSVANQILGICNRVEEHAKTSAEDSNIPF